MLTESSFTIRRIARDINARVYGFDRYIDIGVELHVVRQAADGEHVLPSGIQVKTLRVHRWGGMLDTKHDPPRICGPSQKPTRWFCSEDQEPIVMHDDAGPLARLVIGSEGAGKTTALAMWHHRMWVTQGIGESREGGQTAPTLSRLGLVKDEILKLWPSPWRRFVNRDDFTGFELADGCRIRFVSTAPRPEKQGSPIQGFNWSWCGRDEVQDQVAVHADIESRGRAARGGRYKQLGTATAKDDPHWRTFRDGLLAGGKWGRSMLLIERSPFVAPMFLADKRASGITDREFRRRFLAEDVPPESRLYFNWSREHNLRPVPLVGARRITSIVLRAKTGNPLHTLLVGHDPGTAKAASIFLEAYQLPGEPLPCWWVRGELFTLHATCEQHAIQVLERARTFGCNASPDGERAHVRAQPVGQSEDKPDMDVYRVFKRVGLDIKAAQHKVDGTGTGHISRDSRIDMVNILLCDAVGRRRLFVDCDDLRKPKAPKLVEAFETMERDERGRALSDKRLDYDKSDPADALGYALWPWEKEAASNIRAAVARAAKR